MGLLDRFRSVLGQTTPGAPGSERASSQKTTPAIGIAPSEELLLCAQHTLEEAITHLGRPCRLEKLVSESSRIRSEARSIRSFQSRVRGATQEIFPDDLWLSGPMSRLISALFIPFSPLEFSFDRASYGPQRNREDEGFLISRLAHEINRMGISAEANNIGGLAGAYGRAKFMVNCSVFYLDGMRAMAGIDISVFLGTIRSVDDTEGELISQRLFGIRNDPIAFSINYHFHLGAEVSLWMPLAKVESELGVSRVAVVLKKLLCSANLEIAWFLERGLLSRYYETTGMGKKECPADELSVTNGTKRESHLAKWESRMSSDLEIDGARYFMVGDLVCSLEYLSGRGVLTVPLDSPDGSAPYGLVEALNGRQRDFFVRVSCGSWTVSGPQAGVARRGSTHLKFVFDTAGIDLSDKEVSTLLEQELNGLLGKLARHFKTDSCTGYASRLRPASNGGGWYKWSGVFLNPQRRGPETPEEKGQRLREEREAEKRKRIIKDAISALGYKKFGDAERLAAEAEGISEGSDIWRLRAYSALLTGNAGRALEAFAAAGAIDDVADLLWRSAAHAQLGEKDRARCLAIRAADIIR